MPDGDRNANVKAIGGGVFSKLLATVSGQYQTSDCACAIAHKEPLPWTSVLDRCASKPGITGEHKEC